MCSIGEPRGRCEAALAILEACWAGKFHERGARKWRRLVWRRALDEHIPLSRLTLPSYDCLFLVMDSAKAELLIARYMNLVVGMGSTRSAELAILCLCLSTPLTQTSSSNGRSKGGNFPFPQLTWTCL